MTDFTFSKESSFKVQVYRFSQYFTAGYITPYSKNGIIGGMLMLAATIAMTLFSRNKCAKNNVISI